jgi:hypothetical protein
LKIGQLTGSNVVRIAGCFGSKFLCHLFERGTGPELKSIGRSLLRRDNNDQGKNHKTAELHSHDSPQQGMLCNSGVDAQIALL